MSETLHYGWQDGKFVLLVMSDEDSAIKHRISLTQEESVPVRESLGDFRQVNTLAKLANHSQIDTDDKSTTSAPKRRSLPAGFTLFAKYKPAKGRALPPIERAGETGYHVGRMYGQNAYTNGHIALVGDVHQDCKILSPSPSFSVLEKHPAKSATKLVPLVVEKCVEHKILWFDREPPIDCVYYDIVVERWPEAEFRTPVRDYRAQQVDTQPPYLIFEHARARKPSGVLMPMDIKESSVVRELRTKHVATAAQEKGKA